MEGPPENKYGPPADPPEYYRVVWNPDNVAAMEPPPGFDFVVMAPRMTLYGRKVTSPYPEDWPDIARAEKRGYIMGEWFSVVCPEGELGTNHVLADHDVISEEEFLAAWKRGWAEN